MTAERLRMLADFLALGEHSVTGLLHLYNVVGVDWEVKEAMLGLLRVVLEEFLGRPQGRLLHSRVFEALQGTELLRCAVR